MEPVQSWGEPVTVTATTNSSWIRGRVTWYAEAPGCENCPPDATDETVYRGEGGDFISVTTCRNHREP